VVAGENILKSGVRGEGGGQENIRKINYQFGKVIQMNQLDATMIY